MQGPKRVFHYATIVWYCMQCRAAKAWRFIYGAAILWQECMYRDGLDAAFEEQQCHGSALSAVSALSAWPMHIMNGHIAASAMCCSSCSCCNSCCSWIGPAQDSVVLDTLEYGLSLVCMYGSMYEVGECSR